MEEYLIRFIADGMVIVIALIGGIGFFVYVRNNKWQRYLRAIMAGLSALTTAKLLSLVYVTAERPFVSLGVEPKAAFLDNPGFPSDHAVFVATITLVVGLGAKAPRLALVLGALSLLVGIGRVLGLVHTPLDVLGGFVAAVVGVVPWYLAPHRQIKRK